MTTELATLATLSTALLPAINHFNLPGTAVVHDALEKIILCDSSSAPCKSHRPQWYLCCCCHSSARRQHCCCCWHWLCCRCCCSTNWNYCCCCNCCCYSCCYDSIATMSCSYCCCSLSVPARWRCWCCCNCCCVLGNSWRSCWSSCWWYSLLWTPFVRMTWPSCAPLLLLYWQMLRCFLLLLLPRCFDCDDWLLLC